ncbi:unnamed protein product, partial [Rotaria socialis]
SRDIVSNVKVIAPIEDSDSAKANMESLHYQISWSEPSAPNGLVYFYMIYIDQNTNNGPKEERCVGNDVFSINVTLLPRTKYHLRIITYTIARLNNEYRDREQINGDQLSFNSTNLFFELVFTTKNSS